MTFVICNLIDLFCLFVLHFKLNCQGVHVLMNPFWMGFRASLLRLLHRLKAVNQINSLPITDPHPLQFSFCAVL